MVRSCHPSRWLIAVACVALPLFASAFSQPQWRCTAGPDGGWECGEVAVDAGPFEPAEMAPIVARSAQREKQERPRGQSEEMAELTWVPRQALSQDVQSSVPAWCDGAYQPLEWSEEMLAVDSQTALLTVSAEQGEFQAGEFALLEGGVAVTQGSRIAEAERVRYDMPGEVLTLEGGVVMQEPGVLLRGETGEVDLASGDAQLNGARFVVYGAELRGEAAVIARTEAGLRIEEGSVTRCAPGEKGWQVAAGRIEMPENKNYAVATNARLEVYGRPVFWAPRLSIPLSDERKSGFLFPSAGFSGENGLDVSMPYYLNLASNYDATVTPRLMQRRGLLLQAEFRHLSRHMSNTLGGAFLPEDGNYNGEYSFDEFKDLILARELPSGEFEQAERWLGRFTHRGRWIPGLTTRVDYLAVSDDDYLRDIGTDLYANSRPEIERSAAISLRRGGFDGSLWAQDIHILQEGQLDSYDRLPQVDVSWHERFGRVPMVFGLDFQFAKFERSSGTTISAQAIKGSRVHMEPRFTLPLEWSWGWLEATAAWKYTRYNLRPLQALEALYLDPVTGAPNLLRDSLGELVRDTGGEPIPVPAEDNPNRILPAGSVDMGLRFERDALIAGRSLLQTLEPRLYYLYTEHEEQWHLPLFDTSDLTFGVEQLFRENRFSGLDRINDANQLTAAVTSRLISRADGSELVRGTLGRVFYFDDRKVALDSRVESPQRHSASGWVSELVLRLGSGYDAKALWVWDNQEDKFDQGLLRLRYHGADPRSLFNVTYRSRGQNIQQVDLSFSWPFRPKLALVGRYFYDLEQEDVLELLGGFQYDDCCWRLRLVGREFVRPSQGLTNGDTDTGIFVEVLMKGLAGFDSGLGSALNQGIFGFERQDSNDFGL